MADLNSFLGPNAGYVLELYEQFERDPASVDEATRSFFEANGALLGEPEFVADEFYTRAQGPGGQGAANLARASAAATLAQTLRERGHLAAHVDPLGSDPPGDPLLDLDRDIIAADLAELPANVIEGPAARDAANALEAIHNLQTIYCTTTGYDYEHIQNPVERVWLRDAAEKGRFRVRMDTHDRRRLLERLTQVEGFEQFLHRAYPGEKRFSIQGSDMLVPLLDEAIHCQTRRGNREVILGMAHRGRLAVMAHVLQKPYSVIIAEFEHKIQHASGEFTGAEEEGWTGDVKYHLGAQWPEELGAVLQVSITLTPNPSHLEFVNPVVEGMVRAAQDRRQSPGSPQQDLEAALAVLIHGDAAFPGEGIVAETLNLSRLAGYQTGGTIHIIVNNQVGFTTDPAEGRSTLYASDLAKGFEIPIVHVNADDPEACLAAARLACAYRDKFHKDFLIDLIGYRRWGHNEGDDPSYTQPQMYQVIQSHPTVREIWAQKLEALGEVTREEGQSSLKETMDSLDEIRRQGKEPSPPPRAEHLEPCGELGQVLARPLPPLTPEILRSYNEALLKLPEGFSLNPKLERILERRRGAFSPDGGSKDGKDGSKDGKAESSGIDWAHAETLAFASILASGSPIRLTGQDVARGTFSQRHLVLHDYKTGATHTPLQTFPQARASFALYNSPLSENAALGFEYGYSVHSPTAMVLWEAQFGDFANAGQVIIDQFIASARAKWLQTPALVLLLPHGHEGQGPEHSNARLERFLQLAASDNLRVVNCTTAAQYYHVLRDHAALLSCDPRPLIIMTPKRLLRHPGAASTAADLAQGHFQPLLEDKRVHPENVKRLILCSGKIYYELQGEPGSALPDTAAVVRVEELYPLPEEDLQRLLSSYPSLEEVVWVQEEPENMGAWSYMAPCLAAILARGRRDIPVHYAGRPPRASPAEGFAEAHTAEQSRIVAVALGRQRVHNHGETAHVS